MNNTKQFILEKIKSRAEIFHKINDIQFRTRCIFCGDSQKNLKDAHMYLKCSYNPNEPIFYNCFKCNASGKVNKYFLKKLNIDTSLIKDELLNKLSYNKKTNVNIITGNPIMNSPQVDYTEYRVGEGFTYDDYDQFKIIWNINSLIPYISNNRIKHILPSNDTSISFLSEDKSTILTRYFNDNIGRWKKTKLFPSENKSFYTIKSDINLFSKDNITINIAEGIYDVLSIYKNFNTGNDSVYLAALGSDYESALQFAINTGFIGKNILIKIYLDSEIDLDELKIQLKKYQWLFQKILIYKNIKYKDFGTTIDKIKYIEYRS